MAAPYLHDRDLVIRVVKRFVEILFADGTQKRIDSEVDPSKPGAENLLDSLRTIFQDAERQALEDNGIVNNSSVYVIGEIKKIYHDDPEAMVHSGSLRRLFNDYKDKIDFMFVYILEAHPADGWIMGSHYSTFNDATTVDERIDAARLLIEVDTEYKTFTEDIRGVDQIPILLDNMNNDFNRAYSAQPDRIFVLRDGKFEYIGETVSDSLQANPKKLASDIVRDWLETVIVPTVSTVIQSQREA